jgi:hypothetical protein
LKGVAGTPATIGAGAADVRRRAILTGEKVTVSYCEGTSPYKEKRFQAKGGRDLGKTPRHVFTRRVQADLQQYRSPRD